MSFEGLSRNEYRRGLAEWINEGRISGQPVMQVTNESDPRQIMMAFEYQCGNFLFDQIEILENAGYVRAGDAWYPPPQD